VRAGFAARGGNGAREVTVKGPASGGPAGVAGSFRYQAGDLSSEGEFSAVYDEKTPRGDNFPG